MASDTLKEVRNRQLEADETDRLISSEKVDGTAVYNRNGDRLGTVHHLMIDKYTGQVAYAVMSFGGFLGLGSEQHAIPWSKLTYDTSLGGYRTDITEQELRGAPARIFIKGQEPRVLKAGEFVYIPRGTAHRNENKSDAPTRTIELLVMDKDKPQNNPAP